MNAGGRKMGGGILKQRMKESIINLDVKMRKEEKKEEK